MNCAVISTGFEKELVCRNENEHPYSTIKRILRDCLWQAYCDGYTNFYLNSEWGIPLWAAEMVCALKMYNEVGLHIIIPYEEQTSEWSERFRDRYYNVHQKADSVTFVSKQYYDGCYDNADKTVIDNSDIVIILKNKEREKCFAEKYAEDVGVTKRVLDFVGLK